MFDSRTAAFEFREGPVFTNLLLADEINRTPPKTQAALLEVMEERQVSVDGPAAAAARAVPGRRDAEPDRVRGHVPAARGAARPVPVQADGTAAHAARRSWACCGRTTTGSTRATSRAAGVGPVAGAAELAAARLGAQRVQVADVVLAYVVDLCRATRTAPSLELGASPRGATALLNAAKALAWLSGRAYVTPDDVKAVARPALRHRVRLRHEAELEGVTADGVLDSLLATVPTPRDRG